LNLAELHVGNDSRIEQIIHDAEGHWRKLAAFGMMPGVKVRMLQRWPTLVVRVGRTDVGLDETIAKLVVLAG
jgi:Fe2+ transport system protein FeoA